MRRYASPYPTGEALVRNSVDGEDTDANKYGGTVVGSVGSDKGGGRGFYCREEWNNDVNDCGGVEQSV